MEKNVISLKEDSKETVALKEYINLQTEIVLKDVGALRESEKEVISRLEKFYSESIKYVREINQLKFAHSKEITDLKTDHVTKLADIRWELSRVAIDKAETSINERMEASNNKYALLKEQNNAFQSQISALPTNKDFESLVKQVSILTKLVYIGVGGVLLLEVLIKFFVK